MVSSAILRLVGVGLPIDFMQRGQVETVSPFAKSLRAKPGRGEWGIMDFLLVIPLSVIPCFVRRQKQPLYLDCGRVALSCTDTAPILLSGLRPRYHTHECPSSHEESRTRASNHKGIGMPRNPYAAAAELLYAGSRRVFQLSGIL
jgi:hypothetical protein